MQFTITSALALAASVSAAALPNNYPTTTYPAEPTTYPGDTYPTTTTTSTGYPTYPTPTGEYMGQIRVWNAPTCGADYNLGYVKLNTADAGKCQSLNEYYQPGTEKSVTWEARQWDVSEGWFLYAYTDERCNGTPVSVGNQCINVEKVFPGSETFLAFKVVPPSA